MSRTNYRGRKRPGVALVEVVIATAVVGVLLAVLSLAASDARRSATLSGSIANLKQYAWAGSTYAADCEERFWTFSWTQLEGGKPPYASDLHAAAAQATDIIQRRTNIDFPGMELWVPHILYSHLVLADHLNLPLPLAWTVSPGDDKRLRWQECAGAEDPNACYSALPSGERPSGAYWMVSSSYQIGPAYVSRDMREGGLMTLQSALVTHYQYNVNNAPLGDRRMTQVALPSRKVQLFEQYQRFFGTRVAYYAYPEARVPVLMADGSAGVRSTSESNEGFYPNLPTQALPLKFNYAPRSWEPPTLSGSAAQLVAGYYQWTRGGLTGNDFGAPEVCTGQPGCTP